MQDGIFRRSAAAAQDDERRERLAYLADLTLELRTLAEREGCETLAGLLALARTEALRQADIERGSSV